MPSRHYDLPLVRDVEEILNAAASAGPGERIEYRDRIAAYGAAAIPPLREWLRDERLSAFAIRTLLKIAEEPAARPEVVDALHSVDLPTVSTTTANDLVDAMTALGGHAGSKSAKGTTPTVRETWPGDRHASDLERQFHADMLDIFRLAGEATRKVRPDGSVERGYWASYFLRGVRNHGGREYARTLIHMVGTTPGFERLRHEKHLELTAEALILRRKYASLFTDEERRIAAVRLADAGYQGTPG